MAEESDIELELDGGAEKSSTAPEKAVSGDEGSPDAAGDDDIPMAELAEDDDNGVVAPEPSLTDTSETQPNEQAADSSDDASSGAVFEAETPIERPENRDESTVFVPSQEGEEEIPTAELAGTEPSAPEASTASVDDGESVEDSSPNLAKGQGASELLGAEDAPLNAAQTSQENVVSPSAATSAADTISGEVDPDASLGHSREEVAEYANLKTEEDLSGAFPDDLDLSEFLDVDNKGLDELDQEMAELETAPEEADSIEIMVGGDEEISLNEELADLEGIAIGDFEGGSDWSDEEGFLDDGEAGLLGDLDELPQIGMQSQDADGALPLDLNLDDAAVGDSGEIGGAFDAGRQQDDLWGEGLEHGWRPSQALQQELQTKEPPTLQSQALALDDFGDDAENSFDAPLESSSLLEPTLISQVEESSEDSSSDDFYSGPPSEAEFEEATSLLRKLAERRAAGSEEEQSRRIASDSGRTVYLSGYSPSDGPSVSDVSSSQSLGEIETTKKRIGRIQPLQELEQLGVVFKAVEALGDEPLELGSAVAGRDDSGDDSLETLVPSLFATTHLVAVEHMSRGRREGVNVTDQLFLAELDESFSAIESAAWRELALSLTAAARHSGAESVTSRILLGFILVHWKADYALAGRVWSSIEAESTLARLLKDVALSKSESKETGAMALRDTLRSSAWSAGLLSSERLCRAFDKFAQYDWETALSELRKVRSTTQLEEMRDALSWLIARLHLELEQFGEASEVVSETAQRLHASVDLAFVFEWLTYELHLPTVRLELLVPREGFDDKDANALFRLGRTYEALGMLNEAVSVYEKVRRADPALHELNWTLLRVADEIGDVDALREAMHNLGEASADALESAALSFSRGTLAQRRLGDGRAAIEDYSNALRILPNFTPAIRRLSRLWRAQGHEVYIRQHLADEIEALEYELGEGTPDPNLVQGLLVKYFRLARMAEAAGELDQCIALFKRALSLEPSCEWAVTELERIFSRDGRWVELSALLLGWSNVESHPKATKAVLLQRSAEIFLFHLRDRVNASRLVARALSLGGRTEELTTLALLSFDPIRQSKAMAELLWTIDDSIRSLGISSKLRSVSLLEPSKRVARYESLLPQLPSSLMFGAVYGVLQSGVGIDGAASMQQSLTQCDDWKSVLLAVLALESSRGPAEAVALFEAWLNVNPYRTLVRSEDAESLLLCHGRLLTACGRWRRLAQLWLEYADLCGQDNARWMLIFAGRAFEERCADLVGAALCYESLLELGIQDEFVMTQLERVKQGRSVVLDYVVDAISEQPPILVAEAPNPRLDTFERLLVSGEFEQVVALLKEWLSEEPEQPLPQWLAVDVLHEHPHLLSQLLTYLKDPVVRSKALTVVGHNDVNMLGEAVSLDPANLGCRERLLEMMDESGDWVSMADLLQNAMDYETDSATHLGLLTRLVELYLGPLGRPKAALELFDAAYASGALDDELLALFVETAFKLGRVDRVNEVLSDLEVIDESNSRLFRRKTHARLLFKVGDRTGAWEKLKPLVETGIADREVFELGASVLGAMGHWSHAIELLKKGLVTIEDADGKSRLCFLVGDILQRVLADHFGAAGWFVQAARFKRADEELMRCFLDAARSVEAATEDEAKQLSEGDRFFASRIDAVLDTAGDRESVYLLAFELLLRAGEEQRAFAVSSVLLWMGRGSKHLTTFRSNFDKRDLTESVGILSENARVTLLDPPIRKALLSRSVETLCSMLCDVFPDEAPRAASRLSRRSFKEVQARIRGLCQRLRLPEVQMWNGGRMKGSVEALMLPAPALFLSRDVLEGEWDARTYFEVVSALESFRFSRASAVRRSSEELLAVLQSVKIWIRDGSLHGSDYIRDLDAVKLRGRLEKLPVRSTQILRELLELEFGIDDVEDLRKALISVCDNVGLLVSGDVGSCIDLLLFGDGGNAEDSRRIGGRMHLLASNERAMKLLRFSVSSAYTELGAELGRGANA